MKGEDDRDLIAEEIDDNAPYKSDEEDEFNEDGDFLIEDIER